MTRDEMIAALLAGLRKCAYCREPATVRGRTLHEKGLPACDAHAACLRDRRELAWAGAVRAAAVPAKPIGGHEFEGEMKARRARAPIDSLQRLTEFTQTRSVRSCAEIYGSTSTDVGDVRARHVGTNQQGEGG